MARRTSDVFFSMFSFLQETNRPEIATIVPKIRERNLKFLILKVINKM
jgi:hypothetical protein